jgi:hypothetical protein
MHVFVSLVYLADSYTEGPVASRIASAGRLPCPYFWGEVPGLHSTPGLPVSPVPLLSGGSSFSLHWDSPIYEACLVTVIPGSRFAPFRPPNWPRE